MHVRRAMLQVTLFEIAQKLCQVVDIASDCFFPNLLLDQFKARSSLLFAIRKYPDLEYGVKSSEKCGEQERE